MPSVPSAPVVLTGDRLTGPLHLGHYAGSLRSRVALQGTHAQYLLLADAQASTDDAADPGRIRANVLEVALDCLAVGIDPSLSTICVQSALPALTELTVLYLNLVTVARLERDPTVREEIRARSYERGIPANLLCHPVAQTADITAFKATLVSVEEDQVPMIEQANEIVRRLNRRAGRDLLPEAEALLSSVGRLPGIDGRAKMIEPGGNAVALSASDAEIEAAAERMVTDPDHIRVSDPGQIEGNVVFTYLDAFDPDAGAVADLKAHYRRGGLGDAALKRRLVSVLRALIAPVRERRAELARRPDAVLDALRTGTAKARIVTERTRDEVADGLGLFRL